METTLCNELLLCVCVCVCLCKTRVYVYVRREWSVYANQYLKENFEGTLP
jgi:hypothetical protein